MGLLGGTSDAGIFLYSDLGKLILARGLNIPNDSYYLPGSNIQCKPFMVGDNAFGLSHSMMIPYEGHFLTEDKKMFNYRLSRARRVIENAFGILASRWRVLRSL